MVKRNKTLILAEFMEGLNIAEGAASQLVTQMQNPKWMAIRDMLNMVKDGCLARVVTSTADKTA